MSARNVRFSNRALLSSSVFLSVCCQHRVGHASLRVRSCDGCHRHWSDRAGEHRFFNAGRVRFGSTSADPARHPKRQLLRVQQPNLHPMAGIPLTAAANRRVRFRQLSANERSFSFLQPNSTWQTDHEHSENPLENLRIGHSFGDAGRWVKRAWSAMLGPGRF